jgi:ribulose-phosphate 3-epimerase
MIEIIPAIMPRSFEDARERSARVAGLVPTVQLDLMDGVFVPEKTWPYIEDTSSTVLPEFHNLAYEIDLMVEEPEETALAWALVGAKRVILHIENSHRLAKFIEECRKEFGNRVEIGLAVNVETHNEAITPFVATIDFVQCMGIGQIGYQGRPFDERVIPKIFDLRTRHPELIISVDGGVNFDSAPRLIAAGANRLVSGSVIFESSDISAAIARLQQL